MVQRLSMSVLCLSLALAVSGQARLSPDFRSELAAGRIAKVQSKSFAGGKIYDTYIHFDNTSALSRIKALGISTGASIGNVVTARVPAEKLAALCEIEGVSYVETGAAVTPMMNNARAATGADAMMRGEGLSMGYKGDGVVVGIIDKGFDYTHPDFYDTDKSRLRICRVWEQTTENPGIAGAAKPEKYSYGTEFDTQDEILAAATDVQGNTHGTHVAGIAAGADMSGENPYYGIAGEADIVLVSHKGDDFNTVNISDAIDYIYSYAASVGKPCVINMSLGSQMGPHDGTSTFDHVADGLQGKGRLLVGSAGNFGASKLHVRAAGGEPLNTTLNYMKAVSADTKGRVDVWGAAGTTFTVKISIMNKSTGKAVSVSEEYAVQADGSTYVFTPASPTRGEVIVATEVNPVNGKPHALITSAITSMRSAYVVGITVTPVGGGKADLWADGSTVSFSNAGIEGWTDGDTECTIAEIGGTGKRIVSVGAFVTSHGSGQQYPDDVIGGIASFSSKGLSADGRMKPEITAPGSYIASSLSSYAQVQSGTSAHITQWNGKEYHYGYMEGTSMAAPFVTGVVAAWLQAWPEMEPEQLRDILEATAVNDEFTSSEATAPGAWGYGKINAYEGLKKALDMAASQGTGISTVGGNAARDAVKNTGDGWVICPAAASSVLTATLVDMSGKTIRTLTRSNVSAGEEVLLSAPNAGCGVYILRVVRDGSAASYKVLK